MKKIILIFSLFLVSFAWSIPADKVPINQTALVDIAKVLSVKENQEIENLLRDYHKQGLMQGAVVIVDSTDGEDTFNYAMKIAKRWQLGDKGKDNGLLMLVALKDRKFFTLTGKGLEGALPDISVGKINRENLVPALKKGQYKSGIVKTINAYAKRLTMDSKSLKQEILKDKKGKITSSTILKVLLGIWVILLVIGSVVLAVIDSRINETPKQKNFVKLLTLVLLIDFAMLILIYTTDISFGDLFGVLLILTCPFAVFISPYIPQGYFSSSSSSFSSSRSSSSSSRGGYRGGGGRFGGGGSGGILNIVYFQHK